MAGQQWGMSDSSMPGRWRQVDGMGAFDDDDGAGQRVALGPGPFARLAVRLLAIGGVVAIGAVLLGGEVTLAQRAELPRSLLGPPPTVPERSVREAFATAFHALEDAGSFTYHGTVEADRASLARPGIQLDGPVRVEGGVFPGIGVSEEVATDRVGRVSETLTENVVVWGRQAPDLDALESQPFQVVFETGGAIAVPMGAALVPDWLSATSERRREAPDARGRERLSGTLQGSYLGIDDRGVAFPDADIVLTLGDAGEPAHVEITSRPDGPLLAMSLDISVSGEVLSIASGGDQPTSITGDVSAEQVEAAGIFHAVELGEVPDFWILYRIELRPESPTSACSSLSLAYQHAFPATPSEQYVTLAVRSVDCPFPGANLDEPITLGSFTGAASTRSGVFARVSDGRVAIEVSTDLPVEELDQLFASIEPFDPATRPEER